MEHAIKSTAIALSVVLTPAVGSAAYAQSQDEEWAFSFTEGEEPQFIPHYGMYTTECSISPATDIDTFEFHGEEGDLVHIAIDSRSNGLDPTIELRSPTGDLLESRSCGVPYYQNCSVAMTYRLGESGIFTCLVYDSGYDEGGNYTLQIERMPPSYHASPISYNSPMRGWVSPATDIDFYSLKGIEGDIIRVIMDGRSDGLDCRIRLVDPSGDVIWDKHCGVPYYQNCSVSMEYTFDLSGDYLIMVSDHGFDEGGEYDLTLQCIFGDCPQTFKLESDPRPFVAGEDVTITTSHGQPRTPTFVGYSIKGVGETPVPLLNVTLDLDRPYQIGGAQRADDSGTAVWTLPVPGNVAGVYVWLQAAQPNATTNVMRTQIQ